MTEPGQVSDIVKKIVAKQLNITEYEITDETNFARDLEMDSLAGIEILMELEEAFGIEIPDIEAERLTKFKQLADYLQKKLAEKSKGQ